MKAEKIAVLLVMLIRPCSDSKSSVIVCKPRPYTYWRNAYVQWCCDIHKGSKFTFWNARNNLFWIEETFQKSPTDKFRELAAFHQMIIFGIDRFPSDAFIVQIRLFFCFFNRTYSDFLRTMFRNIAVETATRILLDWSLDVPSFFTLL